MGLSSGENLGRNAAGIPFSMHRVERREGTFVKSCWLNKIWWQQQWPYSPLGSFRHLKPMHSAQRLCTPTKLCSSRIMAIPLNSPGCVGWSEGKYSGCGHLSAKWASLIGMHISMGLPSEPCMIFPSSPTLHSQGWDLIRLQNTACKPPFLGPYNTGAPIGVLGPPT